MGANTKNLCSPNTMASLKLADTMNADLGTLLKRLEANGIEFRLIELNDRAVSVDDVVRLSKGDIKKDEICKTMVIKAIEGFAGVFLKGDRRLDFRKLQRLFGRKARLASLEEVKRITGVEPGAVCPLLLKIQLIMDKQILDMKKVNFGSGDHLYGIEMKPYDILRMTGAKIMEVSR